MHYKLFNLLAFALVLVMNYLANALPLNGKTTGELSAQYPNLFVPAGVTFSIWGVIYLLLLVFVVLQFREANKTLIAAIGWAFLLSCILNAGWIVAWHYQYLTLSVIIMLGLLASLLFINLQLKAEPAGIIKITFGVYLGWICIATIANITALLVGYSWGGWGISAQTWTMILIGVGTFITAFAMIKLNNPFLALAVIWAFVGIILRQQGSYPAIVVAAWVGIFIVGLAAIFGSKIYLLRAG